MVVLGSAHIRPYFSSRILGKFQEVWWWCWIRREGGKAWSLAIHHYHCSCSSVLIPVWPWRELVDQTDASGSFLFQSFWNYLTVQQASREIGSLRGRVSPSFLRLLRPSPMLHLGFLRHTCCPPQPHLCTSNPPVGFVSPPPGLAGAGAGVGGAQSRFAVQFFVFLPWETFAPLKQADCLVHHLPHSESTVYSQASFLV